MEMVALKVESLARSVGVIPVIDVMFTLLT